MPVQPLLPGVASPNPTKDHGNEAFPGARGYPGAAGNPDGENTGFVTLGTVTAVTAEAQAVLDAWTGLGAAP